MGAGRWLGRWFGAVVWGGLRTWRLRKVREGSGAPDRDPGPNLGPGSDTGGAGSLGRLRIRVLVERNPPAGLRALWGRGVATKCGLRGGVGGCGGGSGMWCVGRGSGWGRGWEGGGLTALCRSRRMESECLRDATAIGRGEWRLDGTDSLGELWVPHCWWCPGAVGSASPGLQSPPAGCGQHPVCAGGWWAVWEQRCAPGGAR